MTLITEIESVVNSRPLSYLKDDINSLETLTPAHFLTLNYQVGIPDVEEEYSRRGAVSISRNFVKITSFQ